MSQTHSFQAEVRQLLDIVIHSLYTDKEIFIRELVSNASDALEKMRLKALSEQEVLEKEKPLEIRIESDEEGKKLTITDTGIGMGADELVKNLGTIAHSGTKAFLEKMKESGSSPADVIGQFGVGFYSVFMVADHVEVYSRAFHPDSEGMLWKSDGTTGYSIEPCEDVERGTRIVIFLKEEMAEFSKEANVKRVLETYSNYVAFPILLNGSKVNEIEALWLKNKKEVTQEEYEAFYKFQAHAFDKPRMVMHFHTDVPLEIHTLLFTPTENTERFGMGQMEPGVSLYCKKVLIDAQPAKLLPEWLRFLRGVVDSSDIPLNVSREFMQDSSLISKLNSLITKRYLKFLQKEAKNNPEEYAAFYEAFSRFLKEGLVTSFEHREALAGLLRFESSLSEGKTSFEEYIQRAKEGQESIYYLTGTSRQGIEAGPYLEAFKQRGLEVCFFTEPVDEYVLESLTTFSEKKLVRADSADIELEESPQEGESLSEEDAKTLLSFLEEELGERVSKVEFSERLAQSPAAALLPKDAPNAQMKAMLQAMGQELPSTKPILALNARHELLKGLFTLLPDNRQTASLVAQQLADNALIAAGLLEDPQAMTSRIEKLLEELVQNK